MYTRRELLRSSAAGTVIGAGVLASSSNATADGASFGDGVNLQPSYFCDGDQDLGWDLLTDYPDIETVRIEIEPFSFGEVATTVEDAKRWIDEAGQNGLNVIATYHHYPDNGSPEASALQNAAEFWVEHYETLSADTDITVNMMNEWGNHDVTADEYASAYDDAISTVRDGTSYSGPIVCDAPGWGQGTYRLADAVEGIDDENLILSAHVYPSAWNATTGQNLVPADLDVMDETGYPCMIGEFGNYADSTGADWSAIIDYAKQLGWPVIGWAWNGDGSDDPMNMADPYWGDDCSADTYTESDYFGVVYDKLGDGGGTETPDTETPETDTPDTETPETDTPETDTPETDTPETDTPETDTPETEAPDTETPGTETPPQTEVPPSGDLVASIDPGATSGSVGDLMQFWISDETGNSTWITDLQWKLGNGSTGRGWYTDERYDSAGTYTVTLTATDNEGTTSTDTVDVTIS